MYACVHVIDVSHKQKPADWNSIKLVCVQYFDADNLHQIHIYTIIIQLIRSLPDEKDAESLNFLLLATQLAEPRSEREALDMRASRS